MLESVIKVYKKCGETPLDCINNLKKEASELRFLPMTYAGRLDPLAEGVLLILVGDECMKKEEYLKLGKVYEVEVLLGFATDTYDVMGKVISLQAEAKSKELFKMVWPSFQKNSARRSEDLLNSSFDEATKQIQNILPQFIGNIKQSYPPYSSRTVRGKPLFKWAREGKLDEIEIPTRNVFVESIEVLDSGSIKGDDLLIDIRKRISLVKGDFRQKEILVRWNNELIDKKNEDYFYVKLRISCGSGVYVRGIANEIGKELGVGALALKIVRTKIGEYGIDL